MLYKKTYSDFYKDAKRIRFSASESAAANVQLLTCRLSPEDAPSMRSAAFSLVPKQCCFQALLVKCDKPNLLTSVFKYN